MKVLRISILICAVYIALYSATDFVLNNNNLQFRGWVEITLLFFVLLFISLILSYGVIKLYHRSKILGKIAIGVTSFICLIFACYILIAIGLLRPEYVVIKDDQKMVASVESWLDTTVYYYPYKNWFVMGKTEVLYEYYGSTGRNPFEENSMPAPKITHYT